MTLWTDAQTASPSTNYYTSKIADDVFQTGVTKWKGIQFHMHAGSEHTIDGVRHDLEMHTVHYPADGVVSSTNYIASAMGLVFSVDKYTAELDFKEQQIIDSFFESMKWDEAGDVVTDLNLYGSLMNMVDFKNRWVYKGSVTTPPCSQYVYWNVLSTIYPIKQAHLDLFKAKLDEGTAGLSTTGNWRAIQNNDKQDVIYVKNGLASQAALLAEEGKAGGLVAATVIFALIAFFALIGCAVFGYQANQKGEAEPKAAESEMAAAAPAEEEPKAGME